MFVEIGLFPFSYKKKDSDLISALARLKDFQLTYHKNEAALNSALSENNRLEAEMEDLRSQLAKVKNHGWVIETYLENDLSNVLNVPWNKIWYLNSVHISPLTFGCGLDMLPYLQKMGVICN